MATIFCGATLSIKGCFFCFSKENKMKNGWVILVLFLVVCFSSEAYAVPFQNGSFEIPGDSSAQTLFAGSTYITGWTVEDGTIDYWNQFQSSDGNWSIDMDGNFYRGAISQVFDTNPGAWYEVKFDMAGNTGWGGDSIKRLGVNVGDYAGEYSFDISGHSDSDMGWTEESFSFYAADTSSKIVFRSLSVIPFDDGGYHRGAFIDNVRIQQSSSPVPEPSTMLLLGFGISGLGFLRRKK